MMRVDSVEVLLLLKVADRLQSHHWDTDSPLFHKCDVDFKPATYEVILVLVDHQGRTAVTTQDHTNRKIMKLQNFYLEKFATSIDLKLETRTACCVCRDGKQTPVLTALFRGFTVDIPPSFLKCQHAMMLLLQHGVLSILCGIGRFSSTTSWDICRLAWEVLDQVLRTSAMRYNQDIAGYFCAKIGAVA